ncbi:galactose-binding domain-containing protein [Dictyostelium purpureum]|uniref:Galactose-binding domain-containing protein n=1 Tax=Dictyostelium purpureum TaxID=5786 RepID=F0ZA84_DICPU|nr:galactose-binding domain-containing protein [Dictyostelium purpureum]EGC39159.1 galactose-binding domain-containing protein [Dictyostelium purpureum]|eukprot:XP_003284305.1 galactose-binding domain-containing protein [Dictyostelium purpureum]
MRLLKLLIILSLSLLFISNYGKNSFVLGEEMTTKGLHVYGRNILNENGEMIMLRGANRPGSEYCCVQYAKVFDGPSDENHIYEMRKWKMNAVRVPLNEDCWLGEHAPETEYFGAGYRKAIKDYVKMYTDNNMAVILDLHWASENGKLATQQIPMPNNGNSLIFWEDVAKSFKDNSRVLFDLYNEPYPYGNSWANPDAWQCWKNGTDCGDLGYEASGMQQMIDAIRSTGSTNIILLSGIQYATSFTMFLDYQPHDPAGQLGVALHSYDFNYCRSRGCWDTFLRPVYSLFPMVATETGQKDCLHDFLSDFIDYCDKNDIHYLAWSWLTGPCGIPSLIQDYDGTPSNFGLGFKRHLSDLAKGVKPYYTPSFEIYNDKITHWADDWSSATRVTNCTRQVFSGNYSIEWLPTATKSLHFMCWSCIKTNDHKSVEFMVNGGNNGGQDMDIDLLKLNPDQTNSIVKTFKLSSVVEGGKVLKNQWSKVTVDLTALGKDQEFDGFWLKADTSQPTMYVDDIGVKAIHEPPTPIPDSEYFDSDSSSTKLFTSLILILSIVSFILIF